MDELERLVNRLTTHKENIYVITTLCIFRELIQKLINEKMNNEIDLLSLSSENKRIYENFQDMFIDKFMNDILVLINTNRLPGSVSMCDEDFKLQYIIILLRNVGCVFQKEFTVSDSLI